MTRGGTAVTVWPLNFGLLFGYAVTPSPRWHAPPCPVELANWLVPHQPTERVPGRGHVDVVHVHAPTLKSG
jgi:hypothetical protein